MRAYRVLVVDDSIFMRTIVSDLITKNSRFEVIDTAKNGKEAVEKTKRLQPDVITMDIEMPEMNGLEALRIIMEEAPTPVIMLSSLTQEGTKATIEALELGAVDFVGKPSGSISLDLYKVEANLHEKLAVAVLTKHEKRVHLSNWAEPNEKPVKASKKQRFSTNSFEHIVAIGTSTGGPRALNKVIPFIPSGFHAPILIVQHMPAGFTKSLADRLHSISQINVVEAEQEMEVTNGTAYIAPGGHHMQLVRHHNGSYQIEISDGSPRTGHRPSVDYLFESLLPFSELKRHAVLMTGMGRDGSRGMLALHKAGAASTIAESEETCVIYGMPKAAVDLQCVSHIVPLQHIAEQLIGLINEKGVTNHGHE